MVKFDYPWISNSHVAEDITSVASEYAQKVPIDFGQRHAEIILQTIDMPWLAAENGLSWATEIGGSYLANQLVWT